MEIPVAITDSLSDLENCIAAKIGLSRYNLWFRGKIRFCLETDRLLVRAPNKHLQDWLFSKFREEIESSYHQLNENFRRGSVIFETVKIDDNSSVNNLCSQTVNHGLKEKSFESKVIKNSSPCNQRKWATFKSFCVGESNKIAFQFAKSHAEQISNQGGLLVIYGPHGCGKTHLLEAAYSGFLRKNPRKSMDLITAEDFTCQFVQAMMKNQISGFRNQIKNKAFLVIDDLHLLEQKPATQKEFLVTIDAIQRQGGTIVVGMNNHPRFMEKFMPELVDRLLAGSIAKVDYPEMNLRKDYVRKFWSDVSGEELPSPMVDLLAGTIAGNIRQIQGILKTLLNVYRIEGTLPALEKIRMMISGAVRGLIKTPTLGEIEGVVTKLFRLPANSLRQEDREAKKKLARALAMYLGRKFTQSTYRELGKFFGNRNHSSVLSAEKKVIALIGKGEQCFFDGTEFDLNFLLQQAEHQIRNMQS
ncbi:MAG: DnaA ATPase domain-containing protein [Gemmataceae bacterium]